MKSLPTLLTIACATAALAAQPKSPPTSEALKNAESEYYRIVTLPTPEGVVLEAGALCFIAPDKLACASRIGDIWIAEGVLQEPPAPRWKHFASGLHEVLGLAWRDGWLYATQRCEVTKIKDEDGDGRADVFETFGDPWSINGDYHEYAFGSKFDRNGDLWVALCLTGSFNSDSPYRGWAFRISPAGKATPVCAGIRSPGGIGFNAEGDVFYTDNQGPWNGACKLQQLVADTFVGHPGGLKWFDEPATKDEIAKAGLHKPAGTPESGSRVYQEMKKMPELLPPSVYFPYPAAGRAKMGHSTSGFAFDGTGKFGAFKDQLFVGEQSDSTVMRVFLEKVAGHYQGAVFPFKAGFDSGCLALEFAGDGSLFVYGTDRGWGARGGKPFALQRVVWTGRTPFAIREMHARPDGFEFTFTEPLDPKTATAVESWEVETYTYIYQSSYGSPEVDGTRPAIKSISLGADRRSARVVFDAMAEGHVHEFHLPGVRSEKGRPLLHDEAYYTLFYIPQS